jgi:hypothetical protein
MSYFRVGELHDLHLLQLRRVDDEVLLLFVDPLCLGNFAPVEVDQLRDVPYDVLPVSLSST